MIIKDAASAAEFAGSWIRATERPDPEVGRLISRPRAARAIAGAIESQRRIQAIDVGRSRPPDPDVAAAIGVLEQALAVLA